MSYPAYAGYLAEGYSLTHVLSVMGQRRLRIPGRFLASRKSKGTGGNFSDSVC